MFYKKYLVIAVLLLLGTNMLHAQLIHLGIDYYCDGYWGGWKDYYWCKINGSYNGFVIYDGKHPSDYFFKFTITGRIPPDKKEIKRHYKYHTWWEYSGTVEYYICDVYPTFEESIKEFGRPLMKGDIETQTYQDKLSMLRASSISQGKTFTPIGLMLKRSSAKIKIAPYPKKTYHPKCYNIFFDRVGIAIDLKDNYFKNTR